MYLLVKDLNIIQYASVNSNKVGLCNNNNSTFWGKILKRYEHKKKWLSTNGCDVEKLVSKLCSATLDWLAAVCPCVHRWSMADYFWSGFSSLCAHSVEISVNGLWKLSVIVLMCIFYFFLFLKTEKKNYSYLNDPYMSLESASCFLLLTVTHTTASSQILVMPPGSSVWSGNFSQIYVWRHIWKDFQC